MIEALVVCQREGLVNSSVVLHVDLVADKDNVIIDQPVFVNRIID